MFKHKAQGVSINRESVCIVSLSGSIVKILLMLYPSCTSWILAVEVFVLFSFAVVSPVSEAALHFFSRATNDHAFALISCGGTASSSQRCKRDSFPATVRIL